MQPPKSAVCVICGIQPAETVDHIPPKCLFKGVQNAQLRTVPACRDCNNGASSDDEDLRFYISALIGKQNPASKQMWEMGAHKTILRKTGLRESFVASAREVSVTNSDGSTATRIQFAVPVRSYSRVFERTTRGLYFFHSGRVLPANVPVRVEMLDGVPNLATPEIQALCREDIGGGACTYRYGIAPEDEDQSLWIYEFHHSHYAVATTGRGIDGTF